MAEEEIAEGDGRGMLLLWEIGYLRYWCSKMNRFEIARTRSEGRLGSSTSGPHTTRRACIELFKARR